LLWIYYSSQIFLIGAEFTRAWADIIHERGPDALAAQPNDQAGVQQNAGTRISGSHAEKLEALKSEIEANVPRRR
jgi:membrane protein